MKIAIIGSKGMVGSAVVQEAQDRGHDVTAFTRSGRAGTQALDLGNTEALVEAINTHDATVITTASRDIDRDELVHMHDRLVQAAPRGRVLVVGGAGALRTSEEEGAPLLVDTPEFPEEYATEARTFARVLDVYRGAAESFDWTMLAPAPMIAPGKRTGSYNQQLDTPAGEFVSSQDFAVALVDELEKPAHRGERFTVASADADAARA